MKKNVVLIIGIIAIIVAIVIGGICFLTRKNGGEVLSGDMIEKINKNSKLPIEYMTKYSKDDSRLSSYKKIDNYMSKDFEDDDISFHYYGYPNDESDYYLGYMKLKTNKYNILGVTIGDNMKDSIAKIESMGFEKISNTNDYDVKFRYNDISITLSADYNNYSETTEKNTVGSVVISIDSKYLGNRIY